MAMASEQLAWLGLQVIPGADALEHGALRLRTCSTERHGVGCQRTRTPARKYTCDLVCGTPIWLNYQDPHKLRNESHACHRY